MLGNRQRAARCETGTSRRTGLACLLMRCFARHGLNSIYRYPIRKWACHRCRHSHLHPHCRRLTRSRLRVYYASQHHTLDIENKIPIRWKCRVLRCKDRRHFRSDYERNDDRNNGERRSDGYAWELCNNFAEKKSSWCLSKANISRCDSVCGCGYICEHTLFHAD